MLDSGETVSPCTLYPECSKELRLPVPILGPVDICPARPSFRHRLPESSGHGGHPCDLDVGIPCRHDVNCCLAMYS